MDFYCFVNSRDIRAYLKGICYTFTATEAAWIVWRSMDTTVEDKHAAWQYIIRNMPDCCIPERLNTVPQPSLHCFLQELLELQTSSVCVATASCTGMMPQVRELAHNVFDGMWFAFPTPFKRSDILISTDPCGEVMVLDELAGATEDGRERLERFGDTTDMTAYGYFVDPVSGEVYYECMHDYMRLEYCRRELTGGERMLYTVSTELREHNAYGLHE